MIIFNAISGFVFVLFLSLINYIGCIRKLLMFMLFFSENGVVGAKRVSSKFGSDEKLPMAKLLVSSCLVEWLFHHQLTVYIFFIEEMCIAPCK